MTSPGTYSRSLFLGLCLIGAAGTAAVVAQRQPMLTPATARDARELSSVFRTVADQALPAIVTIKTKGGMVKGNDRGRGGLEGLPFDQIPELRQFRQQLEGMQRGERRAPSGEGSGFIIDRSGYVMTNNHVVKDAEEVIVTLYDGREFKVGPDNIATDERTDVAVIRLDDPPADLQELRFGDSDRMQIGDWVLAIGAPFGYDLTVTQGIVSAKGRGIPDLPKEFLQTDAAVNPGNSGGPLLNLDGDVIGINTAISTSTGGYVGISFAIPSRNAKWAADQLVRNGVVRRAGLGVAVDNIGFDDAKALQLGSLHGVRVTRVVPGQTAAIGGVLEDDILVEIDGRKIRNANNLQSIVEQLGIGQTYPLVLYRDGVREQIDVEMKAIDFAEIARELGGRNGLRQRERMRIPMQNDQFDIPAERAGDAMGLVVVESTPNAALQLGLEPGDGVLVQSVARGSAAAAAGIKAGNIIRKVGSTPVSSVQDYRRALGQESLRDGILLQVENQTGSILVRIQSNRR